MAKRIRSAVKKHHQSLKRRVRNVHLRSVLKSVIKELNTAIEAKDLTKSQETLKFTVSTLNKAASKGVIHKKTASRNVARLSKRVHELSKQTAQPTT
jgi:small subunit ribosomal protein S20